MTPNESLSEAAVQRAAALLLDARARRIRLTDWPADLVPASQWEAERICAAMARGFEAPIGAWKVGALDPALAVKRGLERPFCGQVPRALMYASGVELPWHHLLRPVVEAEIALVLRAALPARAHEYSMAEITDAVEAVAPAIEIPESRLIDGHGLGALGMVADQGFAGRLVLGEPLRAWRDIDLAVCQVRMQVGNGNAVHGTGARAMGNPLQALHWLANHLRLHGDGLQQGQAISTGSLTGIQPTQPGDSVVAVFDRLGEVRLRLR